MARNAISQIDSWRITAGLGAVTATYSALGGLPVSILTDKVQGVASMLLAAVVSIGATERAGGEATAEGWEEALQVTGKSWATSGAVVVVLTVLPLFHQGMWQRVMAAESDR